MEKLLAGYRRYRASRWPELRALHRYLAEQGQSPKVLIIACSDSRVDPTTIFDAGPGELFVIRNVANLAPPFEEGGGYHGTSAAIEFAALALKVPHIIVLGHSHCGGVEAYRQKVKGHVPERGFIGRWLTLLDNLKVLETDVFAHGEEVAFELAAIRSSLANLRTFPFIKKRMNEGLLALHGLHFDIASGELIELDEASDNFAALNGA
jgi:carbonic anhydrase